MSKTLIVVGAVLIAAGIALKFGVPIGRLPGDLAFRRGNATFYFPIVTCLLVSVVLSVVAWLLRR